MKICAACSKTLPKDKFSKKQWQTRQHRRCKECIAGNRDVKLEQESDDDFPSPPAWTDEQLFKQPPPNEECPICFLPRPIDEGEITYSSCCGKVICSGCMHAVEPGKDGHCCPFCRSPAPWSDEEWVDQMKERVEGGDAIAICNLGCLYRDGECGLRQNKGKAVKLFLQAGELGHAGAQCNVGYAYRYGEGVRRDEARAKCY